MALIGKRNLLKLVRETQSGFYLDGGEHGEILLPGRYIPKGAKPDDELDVFIYRDSEDRLVATTETPRAMVGDFAALRVVSMQPRIGAFLDWGLEKDLLLPIRELGGFRSEGDWVVVYIHLDEKSNRIVASSRLTKWCDKTPSYIRNQPVKLIITDESPLGFNAIVDNKYRGLLYHKELADSLAIGQHVEGFVRSVRPDGKIDLALDKTGFNRIKPLTEQILETLKNAGGTLPLHDKSSPAEIRATFSVSKTAFKQAIGILYKGRLIRIEPGEIHLVTSPLFP
ncbi:MAG: S1-like domain-containing RNA-binding protein [Chthoniobacterales bacterium]